MTTDDLRRVACAHCGQVLAHHARAAQQVAVVNQLMAQQMGGAAWGQPPPFGVPPPFGSPPPYGAPPYGAPPPYGYGPMAHAGTQKAAMGAAIVGIIIAVVAVVLVLAGVVFALLLRP